MAAGAAAKAAPCCGGSVIMAAGAAAKAAPCFGGSVAVMVADAADSFLTFNTSPFSSPASSCDDGRVSGSIFPLCLLQGAWFEGGSTYPPLATKAQQSLKCEMVKR